MHRMLILALSILLPSSIVASPDDSLRYYLTELKVPYGIQWMRIAYTESGRKLDSRFARTCNNYFSMHRAKARATTHCGNCDGYRAARYRSIRDCVLDLKLRLQKYPPKRSETFYDYLLRTKWNPKGRAYIQYIKRVRVHKMRSSNPPTPKKGATFDPYLPELLYGIEKSWTHPNHR